MQAKLARLVELRQHQKQAGQRMDRRTFLAASLTTAAAHRLPVLHALPAPTENPDSSVSRFVSSEVGALKKVLVHPPGAETRRTFPMFGGGHSMLTWELLREEAATQRVRMAAEQHMGAIVDGVLDVFADLGHRLLVDQRADVDAFMGAVTDMQF